MSDTEDAPGDTATRTPATTPAGADDTDAGDPAGRLAGRRVVLSLYAAVVAVAGAMGFVIGLARPEGLDPRLFFLVSLPPGPAGMAAYGAVTIAAVLGVLLVAVEAVSNRYA